MTSIRLYKNSYYLSFIALFSFFFLAIQPGQADAQQLTGGGLRVAPTSLTFEPDERGADLILRNNGSRPATYRIDLVNMELDAQGQFVEVETTGPDDRFADRMIRFSPRQVTVAANGAQTVRVAVQRPEGLAPGTYNTRIRFSAIPTGSPQAAEESPDGVAFRLEGIMAVTLPITVEVE